MKKPANFPLGGPAGSAAEAAATRGGEVDLGGDSPELIAFVLLKSIVRLEQSRQPTHVFEKDWLLDTYAECLDAVQGRRAAPAAGAAAKPRSAKKA